MGTRSITHVHDEDGAVFFSFYKQHDGYPEGWGAKLAEFMSGFRVVNGLSGEASNVANGMDCLAAQIIAKFKDRPGQFYICPAGAKDRGEEFVYHVRRGEETKIHDGRWERDAHMIDIECRRPEGETLFRGKPEDYAAWLAKTAEEATEEA